MTYPVIPSAAAQSAQDIATAIDADATAEATLVSALGVGVVSGIDLDGATDIGADLADADLILVDDGAAGTNRKSALSRVWTYIDSKIGVEKGFIEGLKITRDGAAAFTVGAGSLEIGGSLISVSEQSITGMSGNPTPGQVWVYIDADNSTVYYSNTAPVIITSGIPEHGYQASGDATRRAIGWLQTTSSGNLMVQSCVREGRIYHQVSYNNDVFGNRVVSTSSLSDSTWTSFSFASYCPALADYIELVAKVSNDTAGAYAILGVSPFDLGSSVNAFESASHWRAHTNVAGGITFFGPSTVATGSGSTMYARSHKLGSGENVSVFIEIYGGRMTL